MRIDIIGMGAMGLLIGAKLAHSGNEVHFWTHSEPVDAHMNLNYVHSVTKEQFTVLISVHSFTYEQILQYQNMNEAHHLDSSIIIVAVKQIHMTSHFLERLKQLQGIFSHVCVAALQNGVGHIEKLKSIISTHPILTIVTTEGALKRNKVHVEHSGTGVIWIGDELLRDRSTESQKKLVTLLEDAGFQALMSKNIKEQIYRKLLINSVINPLTAIFQLPNGQLPADPMRYRLMEALFQESSHILMVCGLPEASMTFEGILDVCRATSSNHSSMFNDISHNRYTEIDYINGAIVQLAKQHQLKAPFNQSMVTLVRALHPNLEE